MADIKGLLQFGASIIKVAWKEILFVLFVGLLLTGIKYYFVESPFIDMLIVALVLGVGCRFVFDRFTKFEVGDRMTFSFIQFVIIPLGIFLYGVTSLSLITFSEGSMTKYVPHIVISNLICFAVVFVLGVKVLKMDRKTTSLIGIGSTVCGASAIAISAMPLRAEPKQVGTSLISVLIAGIIGYVILTMMTLSMTDLSVVGAAVLPFTGFVKGFLVYTGEPSFLPIKAIRYFWLFLFVPLCSYICAGKEAKETVYYAIVIVFIFLLGSLITVTGDLKTNLKLLGTWLWCSVMFTIGLALDVKAIKRDEFPKSLAIALVGFFVNLVIMVALIGII